MLEINVGERVAGVILHNEAGGLRGAEVLGTSKKTHQAERVKRLKPQEPATIKLRVYRQARAHQAFGLGKSARMSRNSFGPRISVRLRRCRSATG
jgi:hypothetical protein